VVALAVAQTACGLLNVLLLAPIWMQIVHLLLADAVWIALVLFGAARLAETEAEDVATDRAPAPALTA
jgi:heme A synthase